MAKYQVLEKSFINDAIVEEGDIIELPDDAEIGDNLVLIPEPVPTKKG